MTTFSDTDELLTELASLPGFVHQTASPSGDEVAFYYDVTGRNELHVLDVNTGETAQWSDGTVSRDVTFPIKWGSDGERVFFHRDEDGDEQNDIYAISRGGEVEPVVEIAGRTVLEAVGNDGETLLFGSNRDGQRNIFRYRDGDITKLTEHDSITYAAQISPDCDQFAYTTNESDVPGNEDVYVADIDGSNARTLELGEVGAETNPNDWGPESDRLLVTDNTTDLKRLGVYHLDSEEVEWLGDDRYGEEGVAFLPEGDRVVGVRKHDAETTPIIYDLETGDSTVFDLPDGVASLSIDGTAVLDEQRVLVRVTTPTTRPTLLAYNVDTHETETLVEPEYGPFDSADFADAEYLRVTSDGIPETPQAAVEHDPYDEFDIGALFYDSGRRPSPLIVNPHGGPSIRDSKEFDIYTQFLLSLGFSVLQVNYRGSTGRGRAFQQEIFDDWGGGAQGDIAVLTEHVLDRYSWLDDEQVVVFGGSHGGYSAYWQLVQYPGLYSAGISLVGTSDLTDHYENTIPTIRTFLLEKHLGTPEENPDLYEERSPVTHAENIEVPLLIGHGVNDPRVTVSQARLFRDALEDAGFEEDEDYEYHELDDQGHGSAGQEQKLQMFTLVADFLDHRIGTEPAEVID
jgi:dipeptidyl aminopeptidase/acylaminoacyl peptidase